ncbi:MAG: RIP metalloprotease RseP [bacterium]
MLLNMTATLFDFSFLRAFGSDHPTLMSIFALVVVLGVLIFVHELGHFILAKHFGVGVEKFSLGFGPRIFGKRYGETEYLISAIPLGGYVKMIGEDPNEPLSAEDQKRSFNNQKVIKRFLIVVAGPVFNLLFAVLVFLGMFMIGYPTDDTTIGWVDRNSPAWEAGLRPGDQVLAVDGEPVRLWDDLSRRIRENKAESLSLEVSRENGKSRFEVRPGITDGKNLFGEDEKHPYIGIQHNTLGPVVGLLSPLSAAGRAGFKTGDLVLTVNGQEVESIPLLEQTIMHHLGESIRFEVEREGEKIPLTAALTEPEVQRIREDGPYQVLNGLGLAYAELFVRQVTTGSPAEKAGIQVDDLIVEIDGKPIFTFPELQEKVGGKPGVPLKLKLVRAGKGLTLTVTPDATTEKDFLGNKISVGKIGIYSANYPKPGPTILVRYNPFTAFYKALAMTGEFIVLILISLVKLIQQVIPAETMGGPIMIAQLAGQQIQYGVLELFKFMALISINLGILNLLPIPILDGGHILFFGIEGIIGRPVSLKKREIAQQVGLFLLVSLILFVTYNDIMRLFG